MITNFITESKLAKAESVNPYQTVIEFIFTDFGPNKNNQAIPPEEADNIINSAIGMPIKIALASKKGHKSAIPVGPIQSIWRGKDGDRDVLFARAALWTLDYPEVESYLKNAYAEGTSVGTSWEIKYETAETIDNVQWLKDTICVGTAIVDNPAYGGTRTRILAVAESTMEEERTQIEQLFDKLNTVYRKLSEMYEYTYEIEEAEAAKPANIDDFLTMFSMLAETLNNRAKSAGIAMSETVETLQQEVKTLKEDKLFTNRSIALSEFFTPEELQSKRETILEMTDNHFTAYKNDLHKVAKAEVKAPKAPNFVGRPETTIDDIVLELRKK